MGWNENEMGWAPKGQKQKGTKKVSFEGADKGERDKRGWGEERARRHHQGERLID